ncbi:MAG: ribosomal L7Ae/L30e/S12e/Gadd45 family protein [Firmicutes bacterium]|nr:ribosomal L7Ae/L30e/S12e/Gadd45 family protein [Bacillota bacterium]MDD4693330.1 ribosomal L7Ae/L30e/S12e/Gadd45 family protein [Bacillota bacterium]
MPLDQLKMARKKAIGTKQVLRAVENKGASLVFVAQDADATILGKIKTSCNTQGVKIEPVKTKTQLGEACGIDVGAATAAILKD